jgi:hypothetical protein
MTTVYVQAKVDIDDVLGDIGLDELSKHLRRALGHDERLKLAKVLLTDKPGDREKDPDDLSPFVEEALAMLRASRAADAELVLDRAAHPKWRSAEAAILAFKSLTQ